MVWKSEFGSQNVKKKVNNLSAAALLLSYKQCSILNTNLYTAYGTRQCAHVLASTLSFSRAAERPGARYCYIGRPHWQAAVHGCRHIERTNEWRLHAHIHHIAVVGITHSTIQVQPTRPTSVCCTAGHTHTQPASVLAG